ncbi:amidase [Solicola gregarius]|uniref:Amidase n=1 Tax=Solicola gregarius TaxID=2908642 RepID=A0AA46YMB2_9ACTN|nr:amidase [Solicola gregarius]UYM06356.1 amidase [Solicola gregarius]
MPSLHRDDGADLTLLSAVDLVRRFFRRELSPVEVMRWTIERCERINPSLNALVDTLFEDALDQAVQAERRYLHGTARPLEGIPVALKAQQPMKGRPWADGSVALADRVADVDHPIVARIRAAGGIIHARTATPEFCCMPFTHSILWGTTRNPWNPDLSPGGSSGGSVAALASGMTVLATGSDSGGSLRSPASFTGTVGFKPAYGTVATISPANLDPFWQDGALARTVDDCALLHEIIAGQDRSDMSSLPRIGGRPAPTTPVRVAVLTNLGNWRVDHEIVADVTRVSVALAEAGTEVRPAELGWDRVSVNRLADAHFGDHSAADIARLATTSDDLTDYARSFAQRTTEAARHLTPQDRHRETGDMYRQVAELLERVDIIICPTVGITGLTAGEAYLSELPTVDGMRLESLSDINLTRPFNILNRLPAISVPSGRIASSGLPLGIQIVGRPYDEPTVLSFARSVERILRPSRRWPIVARSSPTVPKPRPR